MTVEGTVYLDHAGTTPLDPKVLDAMVPYFTQHFGNPSSLHSVAAADSNGEKYGLPLGYSELADQASWAHLQLVLEEVFSD